MVICNIDITKNLTPTNIYVLRLEDNRYYVGKSINVEERFKQHQTGGGAAWTRKYKPIEIVETLANVSPFMEDLKTKEYMSIYGIYRVRGGSYCQMILDPLLIQLIKREIWAAQDRCMSCGSNQHWVTECTENVTDKKSVLTNGFTQMDASTNIGCWQRITGWLRGLCSAPHYPCQHCKTRSFTTAFGRSVHERYCRRKKNLVCSRCRFTGHEVSTCFAKRTVDGMVL